MTKRKQYVGDFLSPLVDKEINSNNTSDGCGKLFGELSINIENARSSLRSRINDVHLS